MNTSYLLVVVLVLSVHSNVYRVVNVVCIGGYCFFDGTAPTLRDCVY